MQKISFYFVLSLHLFQLLLFHWQGEPFMYTLAAARAAFKRPFGILKSCSPTSALEIASCTTSWATSDFSLRFTSKSSLLILNSLRLNMRQTQNDGQFLKLMWFIFFNNLVQKCIQSGLSWIFSAFIFHVAIFQKLAVLFFHFVYWWASHAAKRN